MKLTHQIILTTAQSTHMNYYQEKILAGTSVLIAAAVSWLGAILSEGDARWFFVTLTTGIVVSISMALMTRRGESENRKAESIKIVCGRFMFAVIGAVVGTRILVFFVPRLRAIHDDVLLLAGFSALVSITTFTVGYGLIRNLDDEKVSLGDRLKEFAISVLTFLLKK